MQTLTLNHLPFDAHVHLRRDAMMRAVTPSTARQCWGALVMPNTAPHLFTPEDAESYASEVRAAAKTEHFTPLIAGYLTPDTDPEDVKRGFLNGSWVAMKVYPRAAAGHGTTHAADGINMWELPDHPALPVMADIGMPLLIHPEVNTYRDGSLVDIYDREKWCIDIIEEVRRRHPTLFISAEHGTSVELARYMEENGDPKRLVCTVTVQHMMYDRNDLHANGFQPHLFCYPILKREEARDAWRHLATRGHAFISAGTDSAPHPTKAKEQACGCAGGVFTAHAMVPLYAQVFEEMEALHFLEDFLCVNGPRVFRRDPVAGTVILEKKSWKQNRKIAVDGGRQMVRPFGYHEDPEQRYEFPWRIKSSTRA